MIVIIIAQLFPFIQFSRYYDPTGSPIIVSTAATFNSLRLRGECRPPYAYKKPAPILKIHIMRDPLP